MAGKTSELDFFALISSNNENSRMTGSKGIIKRIKNNSKNGQRVVYLLCKRLIRGLGGNNPCLRQGCFSSIVALLKLLPEDFDLDSLLDIVNLELTPAGNESKLEEGEAYLGQILAYGAFIHSDFLFHKSEDEQNNVLEKLFSLSTKRSYLHHVAFTFIAMFLDKSKTEYVPDGFLEHLKDLETCTLDKLNHLLILHKYDIKSQTKEVLGSKKFFDKSNAKRFALLLMKNKSLKCFEHKFYDNFVTLAVEKTRFLQLFWLALFDQRHTPESEENQFVDKSKNSADLFILKLANEIFKKCAQTENGNLASALFNEKFLSIILKYSSKEKQLVNSVLMEFSKAVANADSEIKLNFIRNILFEQGMLNFDVTTNSRTVLTITNSLSFSELIELAEDYKKVIEHEKEIPKKDIESRNKCAVICLNYYNKIINNPLYNDQIDWRLAQMAYLMKLGFFKNPTVPINRELSQNIQDAFLTSLGHRFPNLNAFHKVIDSLMKEMTILMSDSKTPPFIKLTDEMNDAWNVAVTLTKKINRFIEQDSTQKEVMVVLKIILQYMAIILFKEPSTAVVNILDLRDIFEDLTSGKNKSETSWVAVLVDLFLNLLSKPSHHHRHLIKCTFKFICPHLTAEAFQQIIEVLKPSYESEMEDDEENNVSDSEKSSEDEDSGEEEEDGDDEDEITQTEKLRMELQNVLAGSDNESVDLDEMDEEEGKKLDDALSSVFKQNLKRRKTDRLSKYQNNLAHFRTRVMDLIEICTEVVLPLPYWLNALNPLVDLFASTIGQAKLDCLKSRISCCLRKINSSKISGGEVEESDIIPVLNDLIDKASKLTGAYADMKAELILVLKFLLKSSKLFLKGLKPKHLADSKIFQSIKAGLNDLFTGKNNLPHQLFIGLISIGWDGMLAFLPTILENSFSTDIKYHKRLIGLQMIVTLFKTPQYFDGHLEKFYSYYLVPFNNKFPEYVCQEISTVVNNKEMNNRYHAELWLAIHTLNVRQTNKQIPLSLEMNKIKEAILSESSFLQNTKGICKQNYKKMCNSLSIFPSKKKQDNDSEGDVNSMETQDAELTTTPTKSFLKRKKNGKLIKKKKNTKKLKMA